MRVGVELIATRPWDVLTMMDIAAAADVSKPLLYHYFSTKRDLYIAAVRSAAGQLRRATRPDATLRDEQQLHRALEAHVDWIEANALGYRTVLQGGVSGDPDVRAIVEQSRSEVVDRIVQTLALGRPPAVVRIALRGWVGFLEGACLDWLGSRDIPKPELVRLLAASLPAVIAAADA
ncbi:MAG: TetR/AcrR family transcriptional regulator [Acidimicrobiales bacterium]